MFVSSGLFVNVLVSIYTLGFSSDYLAEFIRIVIGIKIDVKHVWFKATNANIIGYFLELIIEKKKNTEILSIDSSDLRTSQYEY